MRGHAGLEKTTLSVTNGATFSTADDADVEVAEYTTLSVDVNSHFNVLNDARDGLGDINNDGIIYLASGSGVTSGTYSPLSYNSIDSSDDGIIQAIGGVWNEESRTVTVNNAVTGTGIGKISLNINLSNQQRGLITDSTTGKSAGVGFISSDKQVILNITSLTDIDSLKNIINSGDCSSQLGIFQQILFQ